MVACQEPIPITQACVLPSGANASPMKQANAEGEVLPPKECVIPEREETANLTINASLRDFGPEKEEKMRDALDRMKIIINSKIFKSRVLNHEYQGKKTFVDNGGLTNQQIYDKLMIGAESLIPEEDEEIDVDITLYYKSNSTVGYTYPDTSRIWVNDKFFATFTLGKVAANVTHEWTHKVGFGHDFNRTAKREFSVPYGIGTIIKELVDGM
jgi:hypothetical protein